MTEKDRDQILLSMIREYPGYFFKRHPRGRRKQDGVVKEIAEKYGMNLRTVYREKKVAMFALELARENGREKVSIRDITLARENEKESQFIKRISLTRLDRILRAVDQKLADQVMGMISHL